MVKLASAREMRMYGSRLSRNRLEYINAALYLIGTVVIVCGFAAQFSSEPKSGLVLLLIALGLFIIVNVHDLLAHLAGIDFCLPLIEYDIQLALVEFAVPLLQSFGSLLLFLAILLIFLQEEKGYGLYKFEKHASNMLIAGSVLWVLGSIHNSCQIYERADGHVQILQQIVQIPLLMGSLLFLVGVILNLNQQVGVIHHGMELLGTSLIWLGIIGGLLFFIGGLTNVVKVFKMQQINVLRLEKLRGGAQERLVQERESRVPFILEEQGRRVRASEPQSPKMEQRLQTGPGPAVTPYKDVLLGKTT